MSDPAAKAKAIPGPTIDEQEDVMLACRYGDIDDVREFVEKYGVDALAAVRSDNGNSVLHMVCGNGHEDLLAYLLSIPVPPFLLSAANSAGSTPLHWAALNAHLSAAKQLVQHANGPGTALVDIRNAAGHTPLGEAELAGWEEGARWFVEVMNIEEAPKGVEAEVGESEEEADEGVMDASAAQAIEVEIEDADGKIAKMSISQKGTGSKKLCQRSWISIYILASVLSDGFYIVYNKVNSVELMKTSCQCPTRKSRVKIINFAGFKASNILADMKARGRS
ncbi:hypothetical protein EW145_g7162 [Phellinidium pouzarii]|uniref:Uncharacterized protein n=1 Tax=Phellinidium pouzarii TaxID=167371 RepID=A0A4S4KP54_9AGAM|nr:hypothetical protein EW145_g7162 [Phellinidium pouzarii]